MKKHNTIIESPNPPKTNDIWLDGSTLKHLTKGKWTPIGQSDAEERKELEKKVEEIEEKVVPYNTGTPGLVLAKDRNNDTRWRPLLGTTRASELILVGTGLKYEPNSYFSELSMRVGAGLGVNTQNGNIYVNTGSGLGLNTSTGKVGVNIGTGLEFATDMQNLGAVNVKWGTGLTEGLDGAIRVHWGSGLSNEADATGKKRGSIFVVTGSGLTLDAQGKVAARLGTGLIFDSNGKVGVGLSGGLDADPDGLYINIGTGVQIDGGGYLVTRIGEGLAYDNSDSIILSPTYKTKIDGIAEGANKYVLPAATTSAIGGVKKATAPTTLTEDAELSDVIAAINSIISALSGSGVF